MPQLGPGTGRQQSLDLYIHSLSTFNSKPDSDKQSLFWCQSDKSSKPPPFRDKDNTALDNLKDLDFCLPCTAHTLHTVQSHIYSTKKPQRFRHTLLKYLAVIMDTTVETLIDSGASDDFISLTLAKKLGLKLTPLRNPTAAKLANGNDISCKYVAHNVLLQIGDYHVIRSFKVLNMDHLQVVLGKPWLTEADPRISFATNTMHISTPTGEHLIKPDQHYHHIDHIECNLMDATSFIDMQKTNKAPTMLFSLHATGYDAPPDVHSETVVIDNQPFDLWIHNLDSVPPCPETPKTPKEKEPPENPEDKAMADWCKNHRANEDEKQSFDSDSHATTKSLVQKYIEIHIPHEFTPPGQTVDNTAYSHRIIESPHSRPPVQQPYRLSPTEMIELKAWIDKMIKRKFIRPSSSPYGAPILFAPKPDGSLRLCCDFRRLNSQTVKDAFPLPRCRDLFDQLKGAKYFTSFDMLDGYYNVLMHKDSIAKTAIRTPLGSFEFLVLPMGLTNSPSSFARLMEYAFRDLSHKGVLTYLDDCLCYSKTKEEHLALIEKCFIIFKKFNFRLKPSKCSYFMTQVKFLGHIISEEGIAADPKKVEAITKWPELKSVQEVQQFMGLVNYYREHVKDLGKISKPLTDIQSNQLKETVEDFSTLWKQPQRDAFAQLKTIMTSTPILAIPDMNLPFVVQTDASGFAIGGALMQVQKGKRRVIAYMSKKLSDTESRWPPYERELFAIYFACKLWRHYLQGSEVTIESDHKPLIWLKTQKALSRKQSNWMTFLEEFRFAIEYLPGKHMDIGDPLSRRPDHLNHLNYIAKSGAQGRWVLNPSIFDQIDKNYGPFDLDACSDEMTTQTGNVTNIFQTDLSGKHSYINGPFDTVKLNMIIGYYYKQKEKDPFNTSAIFVLPLWTQKKWYQRVDQNMQLLHKIKKDTPGVFLLPSDRYYGKEHLEPGQLLEVGPTPWDVGIFYDPPKHKDSPYTTYPAAMTLDEYLLHYIAQHPDESDSLTFNEADYFTVIEDESDMYFDTTLDNEDGQWYAECYNLDTDNNHAALAAPDIDEQEQYRSTATGDLSVFADWMYDLRQAYTTDPFVQRLKTGENIPHFNVSNNLVYYNHNLSPFDSPKLYIPSSAVTLQQKIMSELHDTPITGHLSTAKTLERLKRYFYWPQMIRDVEHFVKSCDPCKRNKRRTFSRPTNSQPYPIPEEPWQIIALDMKTGLPTTPRGNNAFWVFVDKLTRRGHAVACSTNITAPELARMFFDHVFKHHGLPRVLISDRDTRFGLNRESFWRELWRIIGSKLNMTTANRPQGDGASERYIGTLSTMLRSFAQQNPNDWDLYLSSIEFAYNDSVHPVTGYTPFQLDTGRDPYVPIQFLLHGIVNKPSLYQESNGLIDPSLYLQRYTNMLNKAKAHLQTKQHVLHQRLLDKGTVPITYETGDYVYVEHPLTTHGKLPTLENRYEGPYPITARTGTNQYKIDFGEDHPLRHDTVNADKLIPYVDRTTGNSFPLALPDPGINPEDFPNQEDVPPPPNNILDIQPLQPDAIAVTPPNSLPEQQSPEYPTQKTLRRNTNLIRILNHRVIQITEQIRHPTTRNVETHRIMQAQLLTKIGDAQRQKHVWLPLQEILKANKYPQAHEYISQAMNADQMNPPLFTHGTVISTTGEHIFGYVTDYDLDDQLDTQYLIATQDTDTADYGETEFEQFKQHNLKLTNLALYNTHHSKTVKRVLILCSGTNHDVSGYRKLYPHAKIDSLDITGSASIKQDILTWKYSDLPQKYYDIIHASPPCTAFSFANTSPATQAILHAIKIVQKCLQIIAHFKPYVWLLENPVNRLQYLPFMQHLNVYKTQTTYCLFGTTYKKPTNIWSNIDLHLPYCTLNTPCSCIMSYGHHPETAQSGSRTLSNGTYLHGTPSRQSQKMPLALLRFIMKQAPYLPIKT